MEQKLFTEILPLYKSKKNHPYAMRIRMRMRDMVDAAALRYTGKENCIVLSNLKNLTNIVPKEKIMIRVPHIANFNTADDVKQSVAKLMSMGFSRIDEFEYVI